MLSGDILLDLVDGTRIITLNRPKVKNAITSDMFQFIADTLNKDADDEDIVVTIITGKGAYFTSGFDISKTQETAFENPEQAAKESTQKFKNFIDALIHYPKFIVALVNGPAVGVGVTMLGLVDVTYASDTATFMTPFTKLGLVPEGCSSLILTQTMGRSTASEMLLLSKTLNANEAHQRGLVAKVVPEKNLTDFYGTLVKLGKTLNPKTVRKNKALMMSHHKYHLANVNETECNALKDCYTSDEFIESMMAFLNRKSKL